MLRKKRMVITALILYILGSLCFVAGSAIMLYMELK
jgi:hypothetical protein